jgi:hypothetical protein
MCLPHRREHVAVRPGNGLVSDAGKAGVVDRVEQLNCLRRAAHA